MVDLGIDVAYQVFILFELTGHGREMPRIWLNLIVFGIARSKFNTLGISLPLPVDVDAGDVELLTPLARRSLTGTLVLLLATVVACSTYSAIVAYGWEFESWNGDFGIGKLVCSSMFSGVSSIGGCIESRHIGWRRRRGV